jgi:hypothetical protein
VGQGVKSNLFVRGMVFEVEIILCSWLQRRREPMGLVLNLGVRVLHLVCAPVTESWEEWCIHLMKEGIGNEGDSVQLFLAIEQDWWKGLGLPDL